MTKDELVRALKEQYSKEIRKQLVHSLNETEAEGEKGKSYQLMNQIFSYVLAQLGWTMANSTKEWDTRPLEVMQDVFPKIKKTKWFKEQALLAQNSIDVEMGEIN